MLQNDCRQVKSGIGVFVVAEIISDSFHLWNWIKSHIFPITVFFRQLRYKILHHSNYYFTFNDNTLKKTRLILNICDPMMENNPNKNVNTALEWRKKTQTEILMVFLFCFVFAFKTTLLSGAKLERWPIPFKGRQKLWLFSLDSFCHLLIQPAVVR